MGLKAIIDSLENVPEALHEFYREDDGKFVLNLDDDVRNHPRVSALSNAYRQEQNRRRELAEKLQQAEERLEALPEDFDADEYVRLKQEGGKAKPDERLAQLREQLERNHDKEVRKREERIAALEGQIRRTTVDDGLTRALVDANIAKEFLPAAKALLKDKGVVKLEEQDGNFSAIVETDMGPMPLSKYVGEWAGTDEGKVFVSKATGGDARGGNGRLLGDNPFDTQGGKVKPNLTQQQELIQTNPERARQMARAVGIQPSW